jgi:hypothetical protein
VAREVLAIVETVAQAMRAVQAAVEAVHVA